MLKLVFIICMCAASVVRASSSQRKYDGSTLSYDPKGRMFQVEYAMEATRRGRTVLGVCGKDCVVLVTRDPSPPSSCRAVGPEESVFAVDTHVGIAACGLRSDIQYVVDCARTWCSEHRFVFGGPMPCQMLSRRLADLIHSCTTRGGKRPLAVDILVGGVDEHAGASLHQVQATGAFQRYRAVAAGSGSAAATARLAAAVQDGEFRHGEGTERSDRPGAGEQGGRADPTSDGIDGVSGRGDGEEVGGGYVMDNATAAAMAVPATTKDGAVARRLEESDRYHRHRPLPAAHRSTLKRALSALWEPSGISVRVSGSASARGVEEGERHRDGGLSHGGLRVAELSAAVYGVQQQAAFPPKASLPHEGGSDDCGENFHDAGNRGDCWDGETERDSTWEKEVGCSREELEGILLELEAEDENMSRR